MKNIKSVLATFSFATIGLFSFKALEINKVDDGFRKEQKSKEVVNTLNGQLVDIVADSSGKKKRKDTINPLPITPRDSMPNTKPIDSLQSKQ